MSPDIILQNFQIFIIQNSSKSPQNKTLQQQAQSYITQLNLENYTYLPMVSNFSPKEFDFFLKVTKVQISENFSGYTLLHALAISVHPELLNIALHQDSINSKIIDLEPEDEQYNNTPLHLLIANEAFKNAEFLIHSAKNKQITIDYSIQDSQGKTTLLLAAKMRATGVVSVILNDIPEEKRIEVLNIQDLDGNTALHYAILLGDVESVKKLIEFGAKKDIQNKSGKTPWDLLAPIPTELIVKTLKSVCINADRDEAALSNEIFTEFRTPPTSLNLNDFTAKDFTIFSKKNPATRNKVINLMREPLVHPQRFEGQSRPSQHSLMTLDEKNYFINLYNTFTGKSLQQACLDGRARLVAIHAPQQLVSFYSLENNEDSINFALRKCAAEGNTEAVQYFVEQKNANINGTSSNGNSPLHWAAAKGHVSCCKYLISMGAQDDVKNLAGETPKELFTASMIAKHQPSIEPASRPGMN